MASLCRPLLNPENESRKLSYILDLRCPPETIRYCCKYIESIYISRERFALWYMWRYISTYVCISICIYMCSAEIIRLKARMSQNILQIRYRVYCFLELCEIQILTIMLHMCSLLNYGFVNVFWYMCVLYCFVPFGKTMLLYCYANKSLESLESWIFIYSPGHVACGQPDCKRYSVETNGFHRDKTAIGHTLWGHSGSDTRCFVRYHLAVNPQDFGKCITFEMHCNGNVIRFCHGTGNSWRH